MKCLKINRALIRLANNTCKFLGNEIILGHNINFDINFLYDNLELTINKSLNNDFIDLMRFSRCLFKDFKNHKLGTVAKELGVNKYEEFWVVWNAFYEKIVDICKEKSYYHDVKEIVHNYLLAWPYWKETAREWYSLKEREKMFFCKVVDDMGNYPPVLYSISKVLNYIGSNYIEDGIDWLSQMIDKNPNLLSDELEVNTIYYIENIVRKYISLNRRKIKMTLQIKKQIVLILNFLVERGSPQAIC